MKQLSVVQMITALLFATQALAGSLTMNGSLSVTGNLTAGSITLGNVTQTNWPGGSNNGVIDLTNGVVNFSQTGLLYRITLTNNVSWVFTNHVAGRLIFLQTIENGTGGWTNAWPGALLWPNGGIPISGDTSPNALNVYQILDNGTSWLIQAEGLTYQTNNITSALQFNGAGNYVGVSAFPNHSTSTRTVEWWAKSTGTGNGGYLGSWENSVSEFNFVCVNNVGANQWYVQTGGGTVYVSPVPAEAYDGSWHHFALVESNSTVTVYIDGTSRTSGAASLSMGGTADLEIGDYDDGAGLGYNGTIDEVRISKVARYTNSFPPAVSFTVDSDTVGYWKFNEGSGGTTADATGINNGTLQGSPPPAWVRGK